MPVIKITGQNMVIDSQVRELETDGIPMLLIYYILRVEIMVQFYKGTCITPLFLLSFRFIGMYISQFLEQKFSPLTQVERLKIKHFPPVAPENVWNCIRIRKTQMRIFCKPRGEVYASENVLCRHMQVCGTSQYLAEH